jgi:transcriptional regulator with XRE-family HTH domain
VIIAGHFAGAPDAMPFGERAKIARKSRGITQAELATRLGISQPAIAELEKGGNMGENTARKLAGALGVTLAELLRGVRRGRLMAQSVAWALSGAERS